MVVLSSLWTVYPLSRPCILLLAVLYRATPVPPLRETPLREELLQFLGTQWHTLKMVGHQLRHRVGGARPEEIEHILEFNRYSEGWRKQSKVLNFRGMIAFYLNISVESIPLLWVPELGHTNTTHSITTHCPDQAIILDHRNRLSYFISG